MTSYRVHGVVGVLQVNTVHVESIECGVSHTEGAWPKDTNPDDSEQVARYRKKEMKSARYLQEIPKLANVSNSRSAKNQLTVQTIFAVLRKRINK